MFLVFTLGAIIELALITSCTSPKNEYISLEYSLKNYDLLNTTENELVLPNDIINIENEFSYTMANIDNVYTIFFYKDFSFYKSFEFECESKIQNDFKIVLFENNFCFITINPQTKLYMIPLENSSFKIVEFEEQKNLKIFSTQDTLYVYETNQGTNLFKVDIETEKLKLLTHFDDIIDTISFIVQDTQGKYIVQSQAKQIYYNGSDYLINNSSLILVDNKLYSFYYQLSSYGLQTGIPTHNFEIECINDTTKGNSLSIICSQNFIVKTFTSNRNAYFICEIQENGSNTNLVIIQFSFELNCFKYYSIHISNLKKYDFFGTTFLVSTYEKQVAYTFS